MILVDTSVWIDHLRHNDATLATLLEAEQVLTHPMVIGELACANLSGRKEILFLMGNLPRATPASDDDVLTFIERHNLMGSGIGYIDTHLLAATALTPETRLWSRDRQIVKAARRLGIEFIGF